VVGDLIVVANTMSSLEAIVTSWAEALDDEDAILDLRAL